MARTGGGARVVAAFDGSGETLALLSADGRLKLWDTATGTLAQSFTEPDHLVQRYTSLAWAPVAVGGRQRNNQKKRAKKVARPGLIALGTELGTAVLWDIVRSEVVQRLGADAATAGHAGRVNDVVFSPDGATLYSCGDDKRVQAWDVGTGATIGKALKAGKSAAHRMAVSPDGNVLAVAGLQIKLFDTVSRKSSRKLSGHALPVTCMAFSPENDLLVSGCGDRYLSIWDASPDSEATAALLALSMEGSPLSASMILSTSGATELLCLDDTGAAAVWRFEGEVGNSSPPEKCVIRVKKPQGEEEHDVLFAASFATGKSQVAVAHGSEVKPMLRVTSYADATGALESEVSVAPAGKAGGALISPDTAAASASGVSSRVNAGQVTVLGAADMPASGRVGTASKDDDGVADESEEMLLGQRVAQMAVEDEDEDDEDEPRNRRRKGGGSAPTAGSLASLLVQALQSDDSALLGECLGVTDPRTITATVARLPSSCVHPLLITLVEKFQSRPHKSHMLVPWIREILLAHASYLITVPNLLDSLAGLYQTVDSRLSCFKRLVKLSGRLELLLAQVDRQSARPAEEDAAQVAVYHEEDDEDEYTLDAVEDMAGRPSVDGADPEEEDGDGDGDEDDDNVDDGDDDDDDGDDDDSSEDDDDDDDGVGGEVDGVNEEEEEDEDDDDDAEEEEEEEEEVPVRPTRASTRRSGRR